MIENITGWLVILAILVVGLIVYKAGSRVSKTGATGAPAPAAPTPTSPTTTATPTPTPTPPPTPSASKGGGKSGGWSGMAKFAALVVTALVVWWIVPWGTIYDGFAAYGDNEPRSIVFGPSHHANAGNNGVPAEPPDRALVEAETHSAGIAPEEPAMTEWRAVPEGYEPLPTPDLSSGLVRMHCSSSGPRPDPSDRGRLWKDHERCVGGWVRFSASRRLGPYDVSYQLHWIGN